MVGITVANSRLVYQAVHLLTPCILMIILYKSVISYVLNKVYFRDKNLTGVLNAFDGVIHFRDKIFLEYF